MKELGIYLHIPFCVRKCRYCDFLSAPAGPETVEAYVEQLLAQIKEESVRYREYAVRTVFFGGGTPSLLTGGQTERILETVRCSFPAGSWEAGGKAPEITMECNPGTVTGSRLEAWRRAGVNRLSLGLQSASGQELALLGRIHTYEDFLESFGLARQAGYSNINVDVMAALPGQTPVSYAQTLRSVLALRPEHISAYSLIVEEGTAFGKLQEEGLLELPDEETERLMYEETGRLLQREGYRRYEISNYALPGYACRHNEAYWIRKPYLGFGLGAASLMDNIRYTNTASLAEYLAGGWRQKENRQVLTEQEQMEEFMFLGLRLTDGISPAGFAAAFGKTLEEVYGRVIAQLLTEGYLENGRRGQENRLRLTGRGVDVSNCVLARFLLS